jgi:hypothetical protein
VSNLFWPYRCVAGIGDDEQDVLDLLVLKSVLHPFRIWQGQLPLANWWLAYYSGPTSGVTLPYSPPCRLRKAPTQPERYQLMNS